MGKQQTIAEINYLFKNDRLTDEQLTYLKLDERTGVKKLIEKYERKIQKKEQQREQFEKMLTYERTQYRQGKTWIAGIDEAGRGPLAGPVVAAAVILHKDFYLPGLNDSKQLSKKKRDEFYSIITQEAVSFGVGIIHNQEIDQINIYNATKKAMKKSIQQLNPFPDHILIDAVPLEDVLCTSESIVKGDQKSISIAAASVIAKVTRDNLMESLHERYPNYNFASNMGYGTKDHISAIETHGLTDYHRKSFTIGSSKKG
ncbi:ribonuclease HII [Aquibacillus rhizosphaerae]|uniref:Ribonuclease HII n=1 Tax=Aquibacillus rhizosphaerae TaxID=3051431 RepID=A0ABT7L2G1_9BACI|nr:ribonuclease HII [Aquibacillus sp. LR5S19]MDL4840045.1 ribonuclease HII [Aquibacillus sp. LR5S19]